jgi:GT2 family glycosyltransferase/tetratricopeptide (TPR) repeat protein
MRRLFLGPRKPRADRPMRKADPALSRGEATLATSESHIRDGDRLRDARRYAEAASAYRAALEIAPLRTDIRVQYGNMLKDSGRLAEAEAAYLCALAQTPEDADLHLQLGHVLKLQGRRAEALAAYRRSAEVQPSGAAAVRELFEAGCPQSQQASFETQWEQGGIETLMAMTEEIARLQGALARLAKALPDLQAQMAFPVEAYQRFRRVYDVPPAPAPAGRCRFGLVLPTHRVPLAMLYAQLAAISAQTSQEWQLVTVGIDAAHRRIVERAAASDPRIVWSDGAPSEGAAAAERRIALSLTADWLVFLAPGVLLHPRAIEWFAAVATRAPAKAYVTDEEAVSHEHGVTRRSAPVLRQVVDYDTLLEANPFGETVAVERATYAALADALVTGSITAARSSLLLSLADRTGIGHVPLPLVARDAEAVAGEAPAEAHQAAVRAHLALAGDRRPASVETLAEPAAPLTLRWQPRDAMAALQVIIPTRDNSADLRDCIASLRRCAATPEALRILVVDNGSRDPATLQLLAALATEPWASVLPIGEAFNWARFNNRAVGVGDAPLLVFANDDMVMLSDGWDRRLRGLLDRPEIGAVGARLVYPDDSLQHAGILLGWAGLDVHDGRYEPLAHPGPCRRWHVTRAVSAVTGAFLAVRREVFAMVGGFDEIAFPVGYSDIDLALKLRARGLKILWTPQITLRHFESKTRGLDHLDPEKRARNESERRLMMDRWGRAMEAEPSLNPTWHRSTLPFRLLSAPSQERLWDHIRLCAAPNPWLPDTAGAGDRAAAAK